jgi:flagellar L-ring protein precursor FlgH
MRKIIFYTLLAGFLTTGCVKQVEQTPATTTYNQEVEEYWKALRDNRVNASLWTDVKSGGTLFVDYKARKIGDIVIVQIIESSSASNSNTTSTSKTTTYNAGVNSFLGMPLDFGMKNFMGMGEPFSPNVGAQTKNDFQGDGNKQKSDQVQATIAARIIDVLPSGNLVIEGAREIVVDQEKQVITVKGVIRQKDIGPNNVVASTSMADAQITYSGKGMLSDVNKKGWLAHFVDWVWPF